VIDGSQNMKSHY
jgi:peptidoglycan hydrolase CwlO-like protein